MARINQKFERNTSDTQTALTEFITDFRRVLAQAPAKPWSERHGKVRVTKALKTTMRIPLSAAGFARLLQDPRYRSLADAKVEMKHETWQDGAKELASVIESDDWNGWEDEPENMASAAMSLSNEIVADLLAAGTSTSCFTGANFFAASGHKNNPKVKGSGTFGNLRTSFPVTAANIKAVQEGFMKRKAANGKPLGLRLTHILVPPALFTEFDDILSADFVSDGTTTVRNTLQNKFVLELGEELTEDDVWYPMARNKNLPAWGVMKKGAMPEVFRFDKGSEFWRTSGGQVAVDMRHDAGGALLLPHAIERCVTT